MVVLFVLVGLPTAIMNAAAFTLLQTEVADGLRARVFSAILVVEAMSGLIGAVLAGTLTERLGVINVLTGQGAAYVLATFAFALVHPPPLRSAPSPPSRWSPSSRSPVNYLWPRILKIRGHKTEPSPRFRSPHPPGTAIVEGSTSHYRNSV